MVVQIRIDAEKSLLAIFLALLLFLGPGTILDHRIKHDFPFGYYASDAFQHQVRAEWIKDAGKFQYEAPYISQGFQNVVARYPPIIYHIAVLFSYVSGIGVYDSIYFIVFFFAIIGMLAMYFIIRDFNKNVALIAIPVSLLTFSYPTSIGFTWGHWPSVLAQSFLIVFFWCIMRIELEKSYALITIILTAIILTHTSEAVFAFVFLFVFFGIKLINWSIRKSEVITVAIAFVISFVVSLHYLIIFRNTWMVTQPYSFAIDPLWNGNPGFYIADFGLLLVFIVVGILFALFKFKDMHTSLIAGLAMLVAGFMNYVGFGVRSFQIRFFWPVYLSIFFGLGMYMLLRIVLKNWNLAYTIIISLIVSVFLIGLVKLPFVPHYSSATSQGIMDQYHWKVLTWLSTNTEADSRLYFFYGDLYNQDAMLRNSKRDHFLIDPDDFVKAINEKKIKKSYVTEVPGDTGGLVAVRTGLFKFDDVSLTKPREYFFGPKNICDFNYLVFDKIAKQLVLAQYNLFIASEMSKRDYITKVFENEVAVVLKNSKPGGDCIEERSF